MHWVNGDYPAHHSAEQLSPEFLSHSQELHTSLCAKMIRIRNPHPLPYVHQTEMFLRSGTLCDTVLSVEGYSFKTHALVLSWASKTLKRQLLSQNPIKGYSCIVDGISPKTVKQILDYVYSDCVEVPKGDLPDLLRGARHLEVQSLMEQCELQMGIQDNVVDSEGGRSSPNIDVEECDSSKKIPSSDETSLSSSLESPLTHFDHEKSQRVTNLSPPPQKPPMSITIATPTASRETISSTSLVAQTPSFPWPSVNPSHHMVLAYTDFMAFQHMVACSYPAPMYPFLQHSLQRQMPSSLVGYTDLLHPHAHVLRSRPFDRPLVPEVNRKSDLISAALSGAALQEKERKSKVQSDKERHCRHCSKPVAENSWRRSVRSTSSGLEELHHECKFCKRGIREKHSLRSLRRGHGGEKPYQCKHCNKRFSLKHQLDTHLRVHTGEKPFECRLCGQRSRDYSAMIKHLRTHGGATPYQCTLCLEFCSSLVTMQKHLKGHPTQDFPPNWSLSSTYLYTCHS